MSEQELLHAEQFEEIKVLLLGMHICGSVQPEGCCVACILFRVGIPRVGIEIS